MVCYLDAPWAYVCLNQDTSKPGYPNFQRYLMSDLNTYYTYKDIHVSRETILFDIWFDTPKTSGKFYKGFLMVLTFGRFYDTIGSPEPFCATRNPDDAKSVSLLLC